MNTNNSCDCNCENNTYNPNKTLYSQPSLQAEPPIYSIPQMPRLDPNQQQYEMMPNNQNVYRQQQYQNPYVGPQQVGQPVIMGQPYGMPQNVIYTGQPQYNMVIQDQNNKICGNPIPVLDQTTALILLVLNLIVLPGMGTMLIGCLAPNIPKCKWVCLGIAQLFLTFCIVGWIWSIFTSVKILQVSNSKNQLMNNMNFSRPVIGRPVMPVIPQNFQ